MRMVTFSGTGEILDESHFTITSVELNVISQLIEAPTKTKNATNDTMYKCIFLVDQSIDS